MEYLEDYDFTLHYHPGKTNVVADALSRKSQGVLASVVSESGRYSRLWDSLGYSTGDQGLGSTKEFGSYVILTKQGNRVLRAG